MKCWYALEGSRRIVFQRLGCLIRGLKQVCLSCLLFRLFCVAFCTESHFVVSRSSRNQGLNFQLCFRVLGRLFWSVQVALVSLDQRSCDTVYRSLVNFNLLIARWLTSTPSVRWKSIVVGVCNTRASIYVFYGNLEDMVWVINMETLNVVIYYAWIVLIGLSCRDIWLRNEFYSRLIGTARTLLDQNMFLARWRFVVRTFCIVKVFVWTFTPVTQTSPKIPIAHFKTPLNLLYKLLRWVELATWSIEETLLFHKRRLTPFVGQWLFTLIDRSCKFQFVQCSRWNRTFESGISLRDLVNIRIFKKLKADCIWCFSHHSLWGWSFENLTNNVIFRQNWFTLFRRNFFGLCRQRHLWDRVEYLFLNLLFHLV